MHPIQFNKISRNVILLYLISIAGIFTILFSTKMGIGINPDSVHYIDAAISLADGHGLTIKGADGVTMQTYPFGYNSATGRIPMTMVPPLYSSVIALLIKTGINPLDAVKYLQAVIFGLNILLVGGILNSIIKSPSLFPILGSTLFLCHTVGHHLMAMTEGLFILTGFSGIYYLSKYLEDQKNIYLLVSAALVSLAVLTRYVGVTIIITSVVSIIFLSNRSIKIKLYDCLLFLIISLLPLVFWLIRNVTVSGNISNREFIYHPINFSIIKSMLYHLSFWALPVAEYSKISLVFFCLCVLTLLIFYIKSITTRTILSTHPDQPIGAIQKILIIFPIVYIVFLILSLSYYDAHTPLNKRILLPVFLAGLIVVLSCTEKLICHYTNTPIKIFVVLYIFIYCSYTALNFAVTVKTTYSEGIGYERLNNSQLIDLIKQNGNVTLYTNGPDAIKILIPGEMHVIAVPIKFTPQSRSINKNYDDNLAWMKTDIERNQAILVWFNNITWRYYLPTEDEIVKELNLILFKKADFGNLYKSQT